MCCYSARRSAIGPIRKAQFVISQVQDEIEELGRRYRFLLDTREITQTPAWSTTKLALGPNQRALYLECMHYSDNAGFQFETRWIMTDGEPSTLEANFSDEAPGEWLVHITPFTDLEISFSTSKTDQTTAEFLDATAGDPIFTAQRDSDTSSRD